ncbi:MAG: sulfurtransferase-like selenium metabolism protein YedF [Desulfuromonadaceae bacterium]|nr:sulfurtransferase-like selenium metabolism protein YedF [Desulfuromonadaceae bacterium]
MIELDYHQHQGPYPVVETRKQMLANPGEIIEVLVGDQTARENISRLAGKMGYQATWKSAGLNYKLTLLPASAPQQETVTASGISGDSVVFCGSDQMGNGDEEFGRLLLKNFLATLIELDPLPETILFVNSGVQLVCTGSEALESLNILACRGVDIASCGLCLEFYNRKDQLAVGRATNMLEIAETLMQAGRLISP